MTDRPSPVRYRAVPRGTKQARRARTEGGQGVEERTCRSRRPQQPAALPRSEAGHARSDDGGSRGGRRLAAGQGDQVSALFSDPGAARPDAAADPHDPQQGQGELRGARPGDALDRRAAWRPGRTSGQPGSRARRFCCSVLRCGRLARLRMSSSSPSSTRWRSTRRSCMCSRSTSAARSIRQRWPSASRRQHR